MTVVWGTNPCPGCFISGRSEGEVSHAKVRLNWLWGLFLGVKGNQPKEQLREQWQYANELWDGPFGCWFTFPYVYPWEPALLSKSKRISIINVHMFPKIPTFQLKDTELLEEWTVDVLEMLKIERSLVGTM